jgi:hypothetical protein
MAERDLRDLSQLLSMDTREHKALAGSRFELERQSLQAMESYDALRGRQVLLLLKHRALLTRFKCARIFIAWRSLSRRNHQQYNHNELLHRAVRHEREKRIVATIMKWRAISVTPVFIAWRSYTRERHQQRVTTLQRAASRLIMSTSWCAWRQWRLYVEQARVADMKHALVTAKRTRVAAMIRRWRMHSLEPSFMAWKNYISQRRIHRQHVMMRMLQRMQLSSIWRAWRTWKNFIEYEKVAEIRLSLQHQHNDLRTEMGRLHAQLVDQKRKRAIAIVQRWQATTLIPV